MIDRYKYLDLLPAGVNELRSMGYKDIPAQITSTNIPGLGSAPNVNQNNLNLNGANKLASLVNISSLSSMFSSNVSLSQAELVVAAANEIKKHKYPVPDVSQMLPFKPIRNACN
jgi:hypothetical protein